MTAWSFWGGKNKLSYRKIPQTRNAVHAEQCLLLVLILNLNQILLVSVEETTVINSIHKPVGFSNYGSKQKIGLQSFLGTVKGSVNPIFLKHIKCCNFQTITVMYIKVYIFWMEISHRINFWYHILLKMLFFFCWENGKKSLFGQKFLWQAKKKNELKCYNYLKIMLRHNSRNICFCLFVCCCCWFFFF